MADEIKQDVNADTTAPADPSAQPELSSTDAPEHAQPAAGDDASTGDAATGDAADINGAAPNAAPESNAENASNSPSSIILDPAAEQPPVENASNAGIISPYAQPETQPSDSSDAGEAGDQARPEADPAAEPSTESDAAAQPVVPGLDADPIAQLDAPAGDAPTEPTADAPADTGAASVEPAANPAAEADLAAPAASEPAQEDAAVAPIDLGSAATDAPASDAATPTSQDTAVDTSKSEADTAGGAAGDVELPFNSAGMAQLGVPGHESGGPIEHPVPATVPTPADPITGKELNDDAHDQLTGGLSKGDQAEQPAPSGLQVAQQDPQAQAETATSPLPADVLQHPVPAAVPQPVIPGTSETLGEDDHAAVTGGLSKGDEAEQPEAGGIASDAAQTTSSSSAQSSDAAPAAVDPVVPMFDEDDMDDEDDEGCTQADDDLVDRIKSLLHTEFDKLYSKVKHIEHDIKNLRRKR